MKPRIKNARHRLSAHGHSQPLHRKIQPRNRPHPETCPAPDEGTELVTTVFLVGKRPPLANYPPFWRWLARLVYHHINWSPDYGIEYQGVYDTEAEARYAASTPGGFYMELPLNAELPQATAQFGKHDFPLSDASADYRNRRFPFVTIPRSQFDALDAKIAQTLTRANEQRSVKAV